MSLSQPPISSFSAATGSPAQARTPSGTPTLCLPADAPAIAQAADLLRAGALVAFPTETVYGLGADATNPASVAALYAAKGRPHFNPLIAHCATREDALRQGDFSPLARALCETFWPGPLTLVVPATAHTTICELARAGLGSVGLRVPSHPVAQALIAQVGRPIVAPSANRSGHVSPSDAAHVLADLEGNIAALIDGGPTSLGLESTVIGCLGDRAVLLRPGAITREALSAVIGQQLAAPDPARKDAPLSPGALAVHYAPNRPVRLEATRIGPNEACLAFGAPLPPGADPALTLNLSPSGNLAEAAANLYRFLRALDCFPVAAIAVVPLPQTGLGEAISDRLQRAARK